MRGVGEKGEAVGELVVNSRRARIRPSRCRASEAIYKCVSPRHVAGRRSVLRKSAWSPDRRVSQPRGSPPLINNRIIRRARSNASLATLSGIMSSGLIARYYFDVRHGSATGRGEREREKERKPDPISRNTSRDCIRETMRMLS